MSEVVIRAQIMKTENFLNTYQGDCFEYFSVRLFLVLIRETCSNLWVLFGAKHRTQANPKWKPKTSLVFYPKYRLGFGSKTPQLCQFDNPAITLGVKRREDDVDINQRVGDRVVSWLERGEGVWGCHQSQNKQSCLPLLSVGQEILMSPNTFSIKVYCVIGNCKCK